MNNHLVTPGRKNSLLTRKDLSTGRWGKAALLGFLLKLKIKGVHILLAM